MGFYGHQKVPPAHSSKSAQQGCRARDHPPESLCPAWGRIHPCWGTVLSPASRDTCEYILHIQLWEPAGLGRGSCRDRWCCVSRTRMEQGPLGCWESSTGVTGSGTNHPGAGGVCTLAGIRGPMSILHFAPEELQISPSPGQGLRRMETEQQQHPRNPRPPAEMPTVSHSASWWG